MSEGERVRIIERGLDDSGRQLEAAAQFGTSADQRAVTIASVYIATATGLLVALVGAAEWADLGLRHFIAGGAAAFGFYAGGLVCVWASRPVTFFSGGNPPEFWIHHLDEGSTYYEALTSQLGDYRRKIEANKAALAWNGKLFKLGVALGAVAPPVAGLALLIPI